jgi:hypothetical protein
MVRSSWIATTVADDFSQRLDPTGSNIGFHLGENPIQATRFVVGFNRTIPVLPQPVMNAPEQVPPFVGGKTLDRRFNLFDRTHTENLIGNRRDLTALAKRLHQGFFIEK